MSFFQDIAPIFKKRQLSLLESRKESEGVYSFIFEKEGDLSWKAGQHGIFHIAHKKVKSGTRPFSVASAPAENAVRITMGIGESPSEFKQAMLELKPGMKISMSGPVGPFYLKDNSPTLLIAGGIGITPFRSILKQFEADGSDSGQQIHLLYLDSKKTYLFKEDFDQLAQHPSIKVTYLDSRDDLYMEIDQFSSLHKDNGQYFVAGSKSMVGSVIAHLKDKKVPKKNIRKDAFMGIN